MRKVLIVSGVEELNPQVISGWKLTRPTRLVP
jgi:hypothetical protein